LRIPAAAAAESRSGKGERKREGDRKGEAKNGEDACTKDRIRTAGG